MKKILLLLITIFIFFNLNAQIQQEMWKGVAITYSKKFPTWVPTTLGSEVVVDTSSGYWWTWDRICPCWREMGASLQFTGVSGVPNYIPDQGLSRFAINIGDSLYAYQGSWVHLNLSTYLIWADTATLATQYYVNSQGFLTTEIDGDTLNELQLLSVIDDSLFISKGNYVILPPATDTSGYNRTLTWGSDTLSISDDNSTLKVKIPLSDSIAALRNEAIIDTVTLMINDTIVGYYVNGGEVGRDTVRMDLTNYVEYSDSLVTFVTPTQLLDSLAALPPALDTSGYNTALVITSDTLRLTDGNGTLTQSMGDYVQWGDTTAVIATKNNVNQKIGGSGTTGYVPYFTSSTGIGNSGVFWDNVNSRLGIRTVSPTATLDILGETQTGSGAVGTLNLAQTWNTTGTPTAIKLNVTDTASNAASLLMDLQVGGSSKIKIDKAGVVTTTAPVILKGYTVATLPTGIVGMRAYVTDATTPTYNGALVGGGAVTVPVFYNGTAWVSA